MAQIFFLTNHRAKLNKPSQNNSLLGVNHLILEGVSDFEKQNSASIPVILCTQPLPKTNLRMFIERNNISCIPTS